MRTLAVLQVAVLSLCCLCSALDLGFPTIALCSLQQAPVYNCSYRRSLSDPSTPCSARYQRLATGTPDPLLCSLYNTDDGAYATDSYGLVSLVRISGEAQRAVLFYTLPTDVNVDEEQPKTNATFVPLDVLLDLIPLASGQINLVRILGRDAISNRYSVLTEQRGAGSDIVVAIDGLYFTYWDGVLKGFYRDLFLDPSTWLLCFTATLVIWYGALRSTAPPLLSGQPEGEGNGAAPAVQPETMKLRMVLLLPISGSLMLLAMFFFLDLMWPLLFLFCAFAGFVSVAFVVWPVAELLPSRLRLPSSLTCLAPRIDELPTALLFAVLFSTAIMIAWWLTDLWLFTDGAPLSLKSPQPSKNPNLLQLLRYALAL